MVAYTSFIIICLNELLFSDMYCPMARPNESTVKLLNWFLSTRTYNAPLDACSSGFSVTQEHENISNREFEHSVSSDNKVATCADKNLKNKDLDGRRRMRSGGGKVREMGRRCESDFCKKSRTRHCDDVSEEQRIAVFNMFWRKMNYEQRKIFVIGHVIRKEKARSRLLTPHSRRSCSFQYSLTVKEPNGTYTVKQVCKNMFLKTLSIGERTVDYWISNIE